MTKKAGPVHRANPHALVVALVLPFNVQPKPDSPNLPMLLDTAVLTRPARHMFPPSLVWYRAKNLITPGRELSSDRRQSPRQACLPGYRQSRKGGDQRPVGAGYRAGDVEVLFQVVCPSTVRSLLRCQSCPLTLTTFRSRKPKTGKRGSTLSYAPTMINTQVRENFSANFGYFFRKSWVGLHRRNAPRSPTPKVSSSQSGRSKPLTCSRDSW